MRETDPQKLAQRQLRFAMLLLATTALLWMTRPQPQPGQPGAPGSSATPVPAEAAEAPLPQVEVSRLLAKGAPPYVADLQLKDPAWVGLRPNEQISAIRSRLANASKDDPRLPKWHLTIAWLYDTALKDPAQAASEYSSLARFMQPKKGTQVAAYEYAAQAKLRAAELYLAEGRQRKDQGLITKGRRELDAISTDIQRFGTGAVTLWERRGQGWSKVADPYGHVLLQIDHLTRDTAMYRALDLLVRLCGGRERGWSMVLALVLLAVGLKSAMYPLSRKSYRSMAEMQKVQPVIAELQKKHRDDPKKLNQEMMKIYADHGVNPLGGCLPMLLQIPVFIFVYQGIRAYTWHFHNLEFLWIGSLAGPDLLLLLLYGVSMFFTQWLTMKRQPTPTDPAQAQTQKMMAWLMPIMFTYMMYLWKLPSAFYLYWLTFNILGAVEQAITHKQTTNSKPSGEAVPLAVLKETSPKQTGGSRAHRATARKKHKASRGGQAR